MFKSIAINSQFWYKKGKVAGSAHKIVTTYYLFGLPVFRTKHLNVKLIED